MKKFTLSHRVVAALFLVVMVLLLTIAYIGSQQTQVYRGRATYGGPTPTTIGAPSATIGNPSPTTGGTCQSSPGGVCNPGLNLPCCAGNGSCVNNACTGGGPTNTPRPPTPTNPFRPTPTTTPGSCVPQSGACCGCGLRANTCTGKCDQSAYGGCQNWCGVPSATRSPSATARPQPSNTPRVPTPTEEPGSPTVLGDVNVADCSLITGWSGDTDDPNRANRVQFFLDGNKTHGTLLGATRANYAREKAICNALGGANCGVCPAEQPQCKHGFAFKVPASLQDGVSHDVFVYGRNLNDTEGSDKRIGKKTLVCGVPTVTPINPTPTTSGPTPTTGGPTPTTGGPTPTTSPTCVTKASGDANCDGVIDGIDYVMWLNSQCNPGADQTCADLKADFNGDGKVNDDDEKIWFNNRT